MSVERLVAHGPDINMSPEKELRARSEAWRVPFRRRRLLGCEIRTWSLFARSLVVAGMHFGVGYAGVTRLCV